MGSPVFKFPQITRDLYERGSREFPVETLMKEITITTGFYRPGTVAEIIKLMEELGYIKKTENGFMIISFDGREIIPEIKKKLDLITKKELKAYEEATKL